jgi:hypothetical protein
MITEGTSAAWREPQIAEPHSAVLSRVFAGGTAPYEPQSWAQLPSS